MQTKTLIRGVLFTAVWTYAAAVWASIGHHLFGLPDLVPVAAAVAGLVAAALSFGVRQRVCGSLQTRQPQGEPAGD
jgi:hypothetical protein